METNKVITKNTGTIIIFVEHEEIVHHQMHMSLQYRVQNHYMLRLHGAVKVIVMTGHVFGKEVILNIQPIIIIHHLNQGN